MSDLVVVEQAGANIVVVDAVNNLVVVEQAGSTVVVQEVPSADVIQVAAPGPQGPAASVAVGAVTTGAAGSSAFVVNVGTSTEAVLNFTIPKGDTGDVTPELLAAKLAAEAAADSAQGSAVDAADSAASALTSAQSSASNAQSATNSATAAQSSAAAATTKANEASASATSANSSAVSASTSAATATTKAGEASTSATNAANSAAAASASAATATTKASEAAGSATAAAGSATSAQNSATTATTKASEAASSAAGAATSASNASGSATAAANSATSASTSASTATTQAGIATTQAGIATTQAGIATTKANEAATSATNAASSATSASTSAATATTKASEAAASAAAADTSEANAAASETAAAGSASSASTSASAALASETAAAASALSASGSASTATTKASEASASASLASTKADDASNSAAAAAASQTAAAASASTASTKASEAAASASNAATSAGTATTQAGIATTKAGEAASSATAALASETAAAGSATAAAASASAAAASESSAASSASTATTQAGIATTQAGIATTKADEAAASATSAANSATTATTKASEASASATAAGTAQYAAEQARDQALAAFDSFDDKYLGEKASDPTVDNDGNPLTSGALYFNTAPLNSGGGMKVYTGSAWVSAYASLAGTLLIANNLSDLANAATARSNLGLGSVENKSSATIRSELTSSDITTALGFTPYDASNPSSFLTTSSAASTYQTILTSGTSIKTVNGQSVLGSGNIQIDGGVTSFNTRTGAVTLTSGDVTGALGFTPYDATNPAGYITSTALAPYLTSSTASSTYQPILVSGTSIKTVNGQSVLGSGNIQIDGGVVSFNTRTGAITLTSGDVTGALGFTPAVDQIQLLGYYAYTATAGQTTFSGTAANGQTLAYTPGGVFVTLNGSVLDIDEYTATNGTSVVLATGAAAGDTVVIRAFKTATLANTYTRSEADALLAAKQATLVSGTNIKTVNGTSILGSGNIQIDGGVTSFNTRTGAVTLTSGDVTGALGYTPIAPSAIGSSVQAYDADLAAIAALSPTADNFIVGNGTTWTLETPAQARASLGGTTAGQNLFTLTNPSAVTFLRLNADNTVSALDAATFRTAIGAGTSSTTGTVTSVAVSGGTTGLTTSGGPVTSSGTITLAGTLALANGGTGATDAATARTNLGVAIGTNVQAWDADLDAIAGLAGTSGFLKKTAANTWSLDTNTYLTSNQSISITGDATGSGATSIALTLANSGVTAGTYTKVTVDAKGRVTSGASLASADLPTYTGTLTSSQVTTALGYTPYNSTNPNGYITGITSGMVTTALGFTPYNSTNPNGYTSNTGTVTSITAGTGLSGGTITTSGTIALANTAVTAGSYTNANITVDAQGRITAASNGSGGGSATATTLGTVYAGESGQQQFIQTLGYITPTSVTVSGTSVTIAGASFNSVSWGGVGTNFSSVQVGQPILLSVNSVNYTLGRVTAVTSSTTLTIAANPNAVSLSGATGTIYMYFYGVGAGNASIGYETLRSYQDVNVSGVIDAGYNSAVGASALCSITSGGKNTAVGNGAMFSASTAKNNTAIGSSAGRAITSGSENVVIGESAGLGISSGARNIIIGAQSGQNVTTGTNNTLIGSQIFNGGVNYTGSLGLAAGNTVRLFMNSSGAFSLNGLSNFGTSGQFLKSAGSAGAAAWGSLSSSDVTTALGFTPVSSSGTIANATNATNLTGSGTISSTTTATTQAAKTSNTTVATTAFADRLRSYLISDIATSGANASLNDRGAHLVVTGNTFIPSGIFSAGDTFLIFNNSSAAITIGQGTNLTMYLAGTANTGNRTLAQRGVATVVYINSLVAVIFGNGLT